MIPYFSLEDFRLSYVRERYNSIHIFNNKIIMY